MKLIIQNQPCPRTPEYQALHMSHEEKMAHLWPLLRSNGWAGVPVRAYEAPGRHDIDTFLDEVFRRFDPPGRIIACQYGGMTECGEDGATLFAETTGVAFFDSSYPLLDIENRLTLSGHPLASWRFDMPVRPIAIFDIDGTLFDTSARVRFLGQEPKDWVAFFDPGNVMQDVPIAPVVEMLRRFDATHEIHLVTARRESDRGVTMRQIRKAGIPFAGLHIVRRDGDHAPDEHLKWEWLRGFAGRDRVAFAVEDRARVARMYRKEGVFVFHVAEGDF